MLTIIPHTIFTCRSKELGQLLSDNGKVRYTTEFMLTIRPFCRDLPPHIEPATLSALADDGSQSRGPPGGKCCNS